MRDQPNIASSNRNSNKTQCWIVLLTVFLFFNPAHAEIYKWVDQNGKIHFTDNPPKQSAASKLDLQVNSFTNPNVKPFKYDSSLISARKVSRDVVMYGASWCGYCKKAKKYFIQNNIRYVEYDIETSEKGRRDYKKLKGTGVPIILVGNQRMNGFSEAGFEKMYNR